MSKKKTTEQFINEAREVHGDEYIYTKSVYEGKDKPLIITCKKHGAFETVASYHLLDMCGGCRKCAYESMVHTKSKWTEEEKKSIVLLGRKRTKSHDLEPYSSDEE